MNTYIQDVLGLKPSQVQGFHMCNWEEVERCTLASPRRGKDTLLMYYNPLYQRVLTDSLVLESPHYELLDEYGNQVNASIHSQELRVKGPKTSSVKHLYKLIAKIPLKAS